MSDDQQSPFHILNKDVSQISELSPAQITGDITKRIESIIGSDNVVLFMKGNSQMPQCGFSANTLAILKHLGVSFTTFDILKQSFHVLTEKGRFPNNHFIQYTTYSINI